MTTEIAESLEPFLVIRGPKAPDNDEDGALSGSNNDYDVPIYFQEDWNTGIGGGLWSTGLAFSKYLTTPHAAANLQQLAAAKKDNKGQEFDEEEGLSVLELGSGNGFLSVCILGLANQLEQLQKNNTNGETSPTVIIKDLAITDLVDHLDLMQKIVDANAHILGVGADSSSITKTRVHVLEHKWGEFLPSNTESSNDSEDSTVSFKDQVQQGKYKFDLIIGSDVAYHEGLYDILIASLLQYSHGNTLMLIGMTMLDTKPKFFGKLQEAGLQYTKFADHLLEPDFRGPTFGIFAIQRKSG